MCRLALLMLSTLAVVARPSLGDVIHLTDGRSFEGLILEESKSSVRIDCVVATIRTTLEFAIHDVDSITYKALPDDFFDQPKSVQPSDTRAGPPRRQQAPAEPSPVRYVEVPIIGEIGMDVTEPGLREALDWAERRGVEHVVFRINSPGGLLVEATRILDLLSERADEFTYHVFIQGDAYSAAMVVVAAGDDIFVAPDARLGAATAYAINPTTGSADVDAKVNAAWAARLSSTAAAKGHPPLLFEASVERSVEVYHEIADDGSHQFKRQRGTNSELIDSSREVLALSASQLLEWGIARGPVKRVEDVGKELGIADWRSAGNGGVREMRRAGDSRRRLARSIDDAIAKLDGVMTEAENSDPQVGPIWYYESGMLTPRQQATWRTMTDRAVELRLQATRLFHNIELLNKTAERLRADHLVRDREELDTRFTDNDERLRWLQRNRDRYRIDDIK